VNAEFNVWLLIVGLVVGAGLVWVVMMDGRRREADIDAVELPREAAWLSAVLAEDGYEVSPETAEQVLLLHRAYLGAPPPDPVADAPEPVADELGPVTRETGPEAREPEPQAREPEPDDRESVPPGSPG
jgi:hypothetical protein